MERVSLEKHRFSAWTFLSALSSDSPERLMYDSEPAMQQSLSRGLFVCLT